MGIFDSNLLGLAQILEQPFLTVGIASGFPWCRRGDLEFLTTPLKPYERSSREGWGVPKGILEGSWMNLSSTSDDGPLARAGF